LVFVKSFPEKRIAVFDSGVGGLSVLQAMWQEIPFERTIYFADQAHVPYGSRSLAEIRTFMHEITRFFLSQKASIIVIACNTASAAALNDLRRTFPEMDFVGMEPAVKPAASLTKSGVVGVLATPATFQGELYNSVVERFATEVNILKDTCPGLVQQIEAGAIQSPKTETILREALEPMITQSIDTIVLGCTHYPFVIPIIQKIVGEQITIINPAPAVAKQVKRIWEKQTQASDQALSPHLNHSSHDPSETLFFTTGDVHALQQIIREYLQIDARTNAVRWMNARLEIF
jgi:glutamate racemase